MMTPTSKTRVKEEVTRTLESALDRLYKIWDDIGIDESQVENRAGTVSMHLCNLLEEMVAEEQQLLDDLSVNIQRSVNEMYSLCQELTIPVIKVSDELPMVERERELKSQLGTLNEQKKERMSELKQLLEQDQALCQALCCIPHYLSSQRVPSKEQLAQLQAHVKDLQAEKEKRHTAFSCGKEKVMALCNEMGYDPDTSFERDLICENDDTFQLTGENMKSLRNVLHDLEQKNDKQKEEVQGLWERVHSLWDRLELEEVERAEFTSNKKGHKLSVLSALRNEIDRCEELKHSNLKSFVDGVRRELMDCWNQCYFSKEQRNAFQPYCNETYSEELLQVHEQELLKAKSYYKAHQEILDLLAKRDKIWKKMLEFEKECSDPNRFFNDRGGKLLREEKARKKLMKELPKVDDDAKEEIEKWEKEHGKKFLVEGMPYEQYIDQLWSQFRQEKEQEKQERHKNKAKQMEEEMTYGSKSMANTPVKRRPGNAQIRTPLKVMKMNESPRPPFAVRHSSRTPVVSSPCSRQPLKTNKTPNIANTLRRRSVRQARKYLQENMRKAGAENSHSGKKAAAAKADPEAFSETTVSSDGVSNENLSLPDTGSYQEFAKGLSQNSRPNCRSSVVPTVKR